MKQNINIGNVVDDGTGDYLRKGGIKINENFIMNLAMEMFHIQPVPGKLIMLHPVKH